jgi:asparagine synthase (glutamine-hydrolysing)
METSDSGLLLHAYAVWGTECVEHLSGDFAFVLWDTDRRRLFMACDPLGVIPLYYVQTRDVFVAANSITSLRTWAEVSDAVDISAVVDFLLFGHSVGLDVTFYQDIRRLPPAHTLVWESGREPVIRRYWDLPEFDGYLRLPKAGDYVAQFRELLRAAVQDRLPPDRAAFTLTGGLDSGSVVALAADICRSSGQGTVLHAYSVGHDWLIPDTECYYAFLTAEMTGVPSEYLSVERLLSGNGAGTRRGVGWHAVPEPRLAASRPSNFVEMYQRASASGTHVVLSGLGGDALLETEHIRWGALARAGQLGIGVRGMANYISSYGYLTRNIIRRLLVPVPPFGAGKQLFVDLLAPALATGKVVKDAIDRMAEVRKRWKSGRHRLVYDTFWATAMSLGEPEFTGAPVRTRHPFLDKRLLEFTLRLPPVPWFVDKYILREAMHDLLPEQVQRRRKTLLPASPIQTLVRRGLYEGAEPLLDRKEIDTFIARPLVKQRLEAVQTHPSAHVLRGLEHVLALCHWLRTHREYHRILLRKKREAVTYVV